MSLITIICNDCCILLKENITKWSEEVECEIPIKYELYEPGKHNVKHEYLPILIYEYDGVERLQIYGSEEKKKITDWLRNCDAYENFSQFGYGD